MKRGRTDLWGPRAFEVLIFIRCEFGDFEGSVPLCLLVTEVTRGFRESYYNSVGRVYLINVLEFGGSASGSLKCTINIRPEEEPFILLIFRGKFQIYTIFRRMDPRSSS